MKKIGKKFTGLFMTLAMIISTFALFVPMTVHAEESYDLWVGSTQVTGENKDDILGDGKVTYNPNTYTLNFNDTTISNYTSATINDSSKTVGILSKGIDLIITGKVNVTGGNLSIVTQEKDSLGGKLTLNGEITTSKNIRTDRNLDINSGTIEAGGSIRSNGQLTIKSNVTRVHVIGNIYGATGITIEEPLEIQTGGSIQYSSSNNEYSIGNWSEVDIYASAPPTLYDLWVGGTQVTSDNQDDVLGDGKVTYNPTTQTLDFDDVTINDYHIQWDNDKVGIFSQGIDLTITGKVNVPGTDLWNAIGVYNKSGETINCTINADITLTRELYVQGNLTIAGGSITKSTNGSSLSVNGTLTMKSDITKIDVYGYIAGYQGITIEEPLVITSPENLTITNGVTTSIGSLSAYSNPHIVIEHPQVTTHTVTFNLNGGSMTGTNPVTVNDGETVTRPATDPTKENNLFVNWYSDAGLTTEFDFSKPITEDTTIYAKYTQYASIAINTTTGGKYSITKTGAYNETGAMNIMYLLSDNPVTFTATPDEGYHFVGWYEGVIGSSHMVEDYTTTLISSNDSYTTSVTNLVVMAVFEADSVTTYKVSFNSNGGTGTMADVTGLSGTYTLPANGFTAPENKQFKGWSLTSDGAIITTLEMTEDKIVYAIWEDIPAETYTILEGDNQTYTKGSNTSVVIKASGDKDKIQSIEIDGGNVIDPNNYELAKGSTILTLKSSFLETQSVGNHTITFKYDDGEVDATLTVAGESNSNDNNNTGGNTGDNANTNNSNNPQTSYNVITYIYSLIFGIICLAGGTIYLKRKKLFGSK